MFTYNEAKAATQAALASLTVQCHRGVQLWLNEARETVPPAWLARFGQLAPPVVTISRKDGAVCGMLEGGTAAAEVAWPAQAFSIEAVIEWLNAHQLSRDDVKIQVALEAESFLNRKMLIPRAALGSLQALLAQEIVHRTPFELADIWHTARAVSDASRGDLVEVEHWIIRRDRAREALNHFGLRPEEVDALVVSGGVPPAVIELRELVVDHPPLARRLVRLAAAGAIATTLLGAMVLEWTAANEMSRLEAAIAELRGQGAGGETAAQMLALRSVPGVVEVWEELSRLLPDHTYLSEMRLADGSVSTSGFSGDAAHLIRLLDQSALFTGAHLTGAITPDKAEHKDHFTLAFRLRGAQRPLERPGTALARSEP